MIKANKKIIQKAAHVLRHGGLVAFPTETVYGLGANVFDARAVARIFKAKQRPSDNPLIVHVASVAAVTHLVQHIPPVARQLMKKFWPGPLTLVLRKRSIIPRIVTAGLGTVCVRMPQHPVALAFIRAAGVPIAAPSANLSGKPSATSANAVRDDFHDAVDMILDGGKTKVGLESTVVDCTVMPPVVLRQGGTTIEALRRVVPDIVIGADHTTTRRSPGTRYRHYAPFAPLTIARGEIKEIAIAIQRFIDRYPQRRVGVLATKELVDRYHRAAAILVLGSRRSLTACARNLFSALRQFDKLNVDYIIAESFPLRGMGRVMMERLERAAQK